MNTLALDLFLGAAAANLIVGVMKDDTEPFKQFCDNPDFKRWLAGTVLG